MKLLDDETLERSAVVANCRMNRERVLVGTNGYDRELGLNPLEFLRARATASGQASWLDLCCGSGKALIEAARMVDRDDLSGRIEIVGVDLVGMFATPDPDLNLARLQLVESSLRNWHPEGRFDLVTCVHGLHYVGDKLGLIARAVSWLVNDGHFVANLSLENLTLAGEANPVRKLVNGLRRAGVEYDRRRRLVVCHGRKDLNWPYVYQGADDQAGPNYTGQPAVNSHYKII